MSCANLYNYSSMDSINWGNLYFTSCAAAFGADIKIIDTDGNYKLNDIYCIGMGKHNS